MDRLEEEIDSKTGRKVYQYIGTDGVKGRVVSRRQHLVDLQEQGKLVDLNVDEISFKRKRLSSFNPSSSCSTYQIATNDTVEEVQEVFINSSGKDESDGLVIGIKSKPGVIVGRDSSESSSCQVVDERSSGEIFLDTSHWDIPASTVTGMSKPKPVNNPGSSQFRIDQSSIKVRNEVLKKVSVLEGLQINPGKDGIRQASKILDQYRTEDMADGTAVMDKELKGKLLDVLTNDISCSNDQLCQILVESKEVRDFFTEDIIQESLSFGARQNILKTYPPDFTENMCLELIKESRVFAPTLLNLVIKVCSKPNMPVDEKQTRKVVQLISQILSCLNQKDSSVQKLIALKLKLFSITSAGLDFLKDLGITQSSRSWQKDCDYLASISKDYIIQELKKSSYCFLVDNLDKVVDGELINFTSVILIADRKTDTDLSEDLHDDMDFFEPGYLKLEKRSEDKYLDGVVYILAKSLAKVSPKFDWIKSLMPKVFEHNYSSVSNKSTFWSYVALLPLSEQKNADMVEILNFINEFTLDVLWRTSSDPVRVKTLIDVLKSNDSTDEDVRVAESDLVVLAKKKGLPLIIGDQLTYERAFVGKELRKGNITAIERFDLLQFRMAMFHLMMAKVRRDYSEFLPSLSNVIDRGNWASFRARLSKHEICNDGNKIKKGEKINQQFYLFEIKRPRG